jgi:conjugal transfer pilus assembly protein TraV
MTSIATLLSSVARRPCRTVIYASVLGLFGCASMAGVGGSAEFGCKAPVGVKCDSVSGTYYNALQQNLPSQQKIAPVALDASAVPTFMDQLVGKRVTSAAYSGKEAVFVNTTVTALDATRDVSAPLRSAPRVLRLWIKHWEDSDGDLHSQSYVYVPIDAGRWLIDHYRSPPRQAYAPIKAPRSVARAASTPGSAVTPDSQRAAQDETLVLGARARATAPPSAPTEGDDDGQ